MNDNKTVEVFGLLARHSRSTHVIHLMWISGEEYLLIKSGINKLKKSFHLST